MIPNLNQPCGIRTSQPSIVRIHGNRSQSILMIKCFAQIVTDNRMGFTHNLVSHDIPDVKWDILRLNFVLPLSVLDQTCHMWILHVLHLHIVNLT